MYLCIYLYGLRQLNNFFSTEINFRFRVYELDGILISGIEFKHYWRFFLLVSG